MAFRIWFYFLILTGLMLLFMWMLQISFIGPYYEKNRSETTQLKADEISRFLERETFADEESTLIKLLASENMCGSIYNSKGTRIMSANLGYSNCYLASLSPTAMREYMNMAEKSTTKNFAVRFSSVIFEQGLYFYGREVTIEEEPYFVFINSPLELLDSTVFVLKRQFGLLAVSVFTFATLVAFALSRRLSRPISKITDDAERLAQGDYTVQFDSFGYSEVTALSKTLNYATSEFRKTDALRRDLVANVSHDIKTPLTMIKAYAEMIQDISGDNEKMRNEHLDVILDETHHLERLVNDMLTLSKYESDVFTISESEFNLYDHILSTVNLFQIVDVDFDIDVPKDLVVVADEIKMGQVLYNFINNATRFVGDDKQVHLHAAQLDKDQVIVSVKDNGPGIQPHLKEQIWDRYYKIDMNFQRTSSTGLGLSIVRAICEATGSSYGVDSVVGEGTSFYYTLKIKQ